MEEITVNGVKFIDHGCGEYSCGMHYVSLQSMPDNIVQDVLDGKYPGIYLNPCVACDRWFYGVYGTPEQYELFYKDCKITQIEVKILRGYGWIFDDERYRAIKAEVTANYKDWWETDQ